MINLGHHAFDFPASASDASEHAGGHGFCITIRVLGTWKDSRAVSRSYSSTSSERPERPSEGGEHPWFALLMTQ